RRAVRRRVQNVDADRQRVRDLAVPQGRRQRDQPDQGRQGAGARAAGAGRSKQRAGRGVRTGRSLHVVRPPPGGVRLQPGSSGVAARHLRPPDRDGVQPDRSVRQCDASGALTGRQVARLCNALRCRNGPAAAQPVVRRRTLAGLPGATRRPGVALHPRPDAGIVLHLRLQGADRFVRREDLARRGAFGSGDAHPVHGEGAPGLGAPGPVRHPSGYRRRAREADPGREPVTRRQASGVQRSRQGVRDGPAGRHASPPHDRQRARAGAGLVARRAVDRVRHVDGSRRLCPEDPRGQPRQRAATHARARLLRSPRVVARWAAHRGDQGATRAAEHFGPGYELDWLPAAGGAPTRITPISGGGRPHFSRDPNRIYIYEANEGLVSVRYDGTDRRVHIKVTGFTPNFVATPEPFPADEVLIAPDSGRVLATSSNYVYLVTLPLVGATPPAI